MPEMVAMGLLMVLRIALPLLLIGGLLALCFFLPRRRLSLVHGSELVGRGWYCNLASFEFVSVTEGTGVLPGTYAHRYIAVPRGLAPIAGPLLGLLFVILLPLVIFGFVLLILARGVYGLLRRVGQGAIQTPRI